MRRAVSEDKDKSLLERKEKGFLYLFLLFEIFDLEILATNYGTPVMWQTIEIKAKQLSKVFFNFLLNKLILIVKIWENPYLFYLTSNWIH